MFFGAEGLWLRVLVSAQKNSSRHTKLGLVTLILYDRQPQQRELQ